MLGLETTGMFDANMLWPADGLHILWFAKRAENIAEERNETA